MRGLSDQIQSGPSSPFKEKRHRKNPDFARLFIWFEVYVIVSRMDTTSNLTNLDQLALVPVPTLFNRVSIFSFMSHFVIT